MKAVKRSLILLLCTSMVWLSGCVKIWQKNLDIKTYMLEADREAGVMEKPLAERLWIESVHVLPPYNIRNLVLRESDVEFSTSYYTELLMAPAENFRSGFYTWFAASGMFNDVSIVSRSGMSHSLAVTVMEFYGDTVDEQAVLKIKVTLFDEKTNGLRVLLSKDYTQSVAIDETSAEELLRAFNRGLTQILTDAEQDVVKALKQGL